MTKLVMRAIIVLILIVVVQSGYSFNRWLDMSPGFRIIGMAVDMDSRVPSNSATTRFEFGAGLNFDIQLEKFLSLELELLYLRKGASIGSGGSDIVLHYLAVPMLAKIWVDRGKFAVVVGPVHNFLIGANGMYSAPLTEASASNSSTYDLGLALGIQYVMADFGNGTKLIGDFRMEFGLVNVYSGSYRPEIYNRTIPYLAIGLNF